jgi:transposase InsO family protein
MSRKGNCWDNAVAVRFFLNLKMERVWQRQYANHAEAKADITDYIVGFYNCKRINSALGNLSPAVYERKMAAREPIVVSEIFARAARYIKVGASHPCRLPSGQSETS